MKTGSIPARSDRNLIVSFMFIYNWIHRSIKLCTYKRNFQEKEHINGTSNEVVSHITRVEILTRSISWPVTLLRLSLRTGSEFLPKGKVSEELFCRSFGGLCDIRIGNCYAYAKYQRKLEEKKKKKTEPRCAIKKKQLSQRYKSKKFENKEIYHFRNCKSLSI